MLIFVPAAFTTASETSQHYPLATKPRQIYHSLQPHPALSPVPDVSNPILIQEQQENEATWRQLLVQGMLAVLLPTEDLENGCLRALVAEIFSELILGNGICGRACENWLLWEATIKIVETLQHRRGQGRSVDGQTQQGPSRLERFGLLSPKEELLKPVKSSGKDRLSTISVSALFWMLVQYAFLAFTAMRAMLVMLVSSSSLPLRRTKSISHPSDADPHREDGADGNNDTEKRPIVSMDIWSAVSHLVELQQRMPWLSGFLGLLHWGAVSGMWKVANTDGVLDR